MDEEKQVILQVVEKARVKEQRPDAGFGGGDYNKERLYRVQEEEEWSKPQ